MEKRALLAIALSIGVLMVWQMFFAPPIPEVPLPGDPNYVSEVAPPPTDETIDGATPPPAAPQEAAVPEPAGAPQAPRIEASATEEFRVKTAHHDVRLSNQGGRVLWWRLPKYTSSDDVPVDLVPTSAEKAGVLPLQVEIPGDAELTRRLATALHEHEIEATRDDAPEGPGQRITFTWSDGEGLMVRKSLWIPENGYVARIAAEVTRNGKPLEAGIVFASGLGEGGNGSDTTSRIWKVEGRPVIQSMPRPTRIPPAKLETTLSSDQAEWAGLESTYFASLALPSDGPSGASPPRVTFEPRQVPVPAGGQPDHLVTASFSIGAAGATQQVFVGPKNYQMLAKMGHGLEAVIDFSNYSIIYLVSKYLFLSLTWINSYIGNYGWSIILLTFIVRFALFPVTYKSMITMRQTGRKMARIQPKVKAIQERYRKMKRSMDTQQKQNQEIMALYQKEGVNPMASLGGCLPLLLQMPIFIGFYNLLSVTIEMRQAPFFGWITDLSTRDPLWITPILMGGSWLLQQAMTSSSIPDPMQRRMMMFMPLLFTWMMRNMPSGLVIYWLTSNVLTMLQQLLINKRADAIARSLSGSAQDREEESAKARRAEDGQIA